MPTALHRLRVARGQTLRQLGADVGVSYETVRRVEHGQTDVHPRTRAAFEQHFGVALEVLAAPIADDVPVISRAQLERALGLAEGALNDEGTAPTGTAPNNLPTAT